MEIMERIASRIEEAKERVIQNAGENPQHDTLIRGFVMGLREVLNVDSDEVEDDA